MSGHRNPGPTSQTERQVLVDHGTTCRYSTSMPGSVGYGSHAAVNGEWLVASATTTPQGKVIRHKKYSGTCAGLQQAFDDAHEAMHQEMVASLHEQYGGDTTKEFKDQPKEFKDQYWSAINKATREMEAYSREIHLYKKWIDECTEMGFPPPSDDPFAEAAGSDDPFAQ